MTGVSHLSWAWCAIFLGEVVCSRSNGGLSPLDLRACANSTSLPFTPGPVEEHCSLETQQPRDGLSASGPDIESSLVKPRRHLSDASGRRLSSTSLAALPSLLRPRPSFDLSRLFRLWRGLGSLFRMFPQTASNTDWNTSCTSISCGGPSGLHQRFSHISNDKSSQDKEPRLV